MGEGEEKCGKKEPRRKKGGDRGSSKSVSWGCDGRGAFLTPEKWLETPRGQRVVGSIR